ncbi:NACHT domain-containing protein [Leptolyngbya boryana CZ1]|uniref:NACHT domain-containing protein n=1 Tax=Leptolyngbya boryana CZ1 TaxID=3060204 RepID=A0AA97ANS5_LEPBY|nr:NACHT domain-containing protein [Leptolyngbya boryana]WNZ46013.1 NACHT domain-containing protein [Leptolyngbya boryana CZ1]
MPDSYRNSIGYRYKEIGEIYDRAFLQKKQEKEQDWREVFSKTGGWAAFAASIFLLIFQDTLKKWFTAFSTAIEKNIYDRFAGTKMFWGIALTKYRQALIGKYRELKIPFRVDRPLKMQDVYVPLKVKGKRDTELIDALDAVGKHKRLMVLGQPGAGKSMLLKFLTLSYAENRLLNLAERPVAILLELYRVGVDSDIVALLVKALERDDFPGATKFVEQGLENGTVMLLLDGLDEVGSAARSTIVQKLKDFLDRYEKCRVILTCRSQVYYNEFNEYVDQTLEVVEFTDQQMRRFLAAWAMPPEKSIDQLMLTLQDRPRILELARNPLLLTIIAYLYCDTPFVLPHSRSEFYQKAIDILLETWDQAKQTPNVYKMREKRLVLRQLAIRMQEQQGSDRRSMQFQQVLAEVGQVLPSLNLEAGKDAQPMLREIVERSGLLMEIDGGERYQFAHLTLQEFFVAELLRENADELLNRFERDRASWREMVKLWCGLVGDSTGLIARVYQSDAITAFECLADAQQVEQSLADQIVNEFKGRLTESDAIVQAFAAVASNTRSRGQSVFEFLAETLKGQDSDRRIAAANALSLTNLPIAAQVLVDNYSAQVRSPLIRMGDLAVPKIKQLAETGEQNALNDLFRIGTGQAAKALVPFLWHNNAELSGRATWHLATLIANPEIENALRDCSLQAAQLKDQRLLDWVWEPFYEARYRDGGVMAEAGAIISLPPVKLPFVLATITGRIAYLMQEAPIEVALGNPKFDPRLVIPVCAIVLRQQVNLGEFRFEAEELLKQAVTPALEKAMLETLAFWLGDGWVSRFGFLLNSLDRRLQLELLSRLEGQRNADRDDWARLFKPLKYRFNTSWHYRTVVGCALLLSVVAIVQLLYLPFRFPTEWIFWSVGLPSLAIVYFWIFLWKGIEEHLEPELFANFGLLGVITFFVELRRLYVERLTWAGVAVLFEIITSNQASADASADANAVAVAFAFAGAVAFAFAVAFAGTFSGAVAVAVAVAFAFAGVFAGAFAGANAFAVVVAGTFAFASTFANAVAVAFAAGAGISFWYRAETELDSRRFLAAFAFPWFCWFPITVCSATFGFLNFFPIWQVASLWGAIVLLCSCLWFRGQTLDRRARNPLQGISALEKYRPKREQQ